MLPLCQLGAPSSTPEHTDWSLLTPEILDQSVNRITSQGKETHQSHPKRDYGSDIYAWRSMILKQTSEKQRVEKQLMEPFVENKSRLVITSLALFQDTWCSGLHPQLSPGSQCRITSCHLQTASSLSTLNSTYPNPDSLGQIQGPSDSHCYLTWLFFLYIPCILPFVLFTFWIYHILPRLCVFTYSVPSGTCLFIFSWWSEFNSLSKALITLVRRSFLEPQSNESLPPKSSASRLYLK